MFTNEQSLNLLKLTPKEEQTLTEFALTIFDIYLAQEQRANGQVDTNNEDRDTSVLGSKK